MRKISNHHLFVAFLLTGGLFILVLTLFQPFYNTDADIYFLYTLSGGYGNPPSELLHYYLGAHPVLGVVISMLFRFFPMFNWYTFSLLLFHFISCVALLMMFLKFYRRTYAIGFFLIFFLFIESRLLLRLNFSGTALMGVISGTVSLLLYYKGRAGGKSDSRWQHYLLALLIIIAGLIRIHYLVLFGAFASWMALFYLPHREFVKYFKVLVVLAGIVFLCFLGQRYYYQHKIPGWKHEEKMRQAYFNIHNHSHKESPVTGNGLEKLREELIGISFLYDKNFTGFEEIKKFSKNNVRRFNLVPQNYQAFYWLFIDMRVYILLIAGAILFFVMSWNIPQLKRFIYMSFFSLVAFLGICFFFKVTEVILLAFLASVLISAVLCLADNNGNKKQPLAAGVLITALGCFWMISRLIKEDSRSRPGVTNARNVIRELNSHPDILFVDAGTHFNFHLSIWDNPANYPIRNLVYNELLLSNSYSQQLKRHGVEDLMKELPVKDNIYLVGEKASLLVEYYKQLFNQSVVVKKVPGFRYIDAYQLRISDYKQN